MNTIIRLAQALEKARQRSGLSQAEVARRMGTAQPVVARLERGEGNPTITTLDRYADSVGVRLEVNLVPVSKHDPVIDLYKRDVDRTLIRENLRRSVSERIRSLGEWQESSQRLREAARRAKQSRRGHA